MIADRKCADQNVIESMKNLTSIIYTLFIIAATTGILASCGQSYEESKRVSRAQRQKLMREDSLALKVGVLPTLDCLPMFVAKERALFDTAVDIRLKRYQAQMDCDEALRKGRLEGNVTDIVRAMRLRERGTQLDFISSTNAYWQLISNRKARIKDIKQLNDKMVAMTRFSATAFLADYAVDSVKMKDESVFRVQINNANLRLKMLLNNEMDAALLTEPQATAARLQKNPMLMDTRDKDMWFGLIAFRSEAVRDAGRKRQMDAFVKGYNDACDSINKYGVRNYADEIAKYCGVDSRTIAKLPKIRFKHIAEPRKSDIDKAAKWLKR